jgi:voltage-dependent potassium channel beta subunit
MEYRRLGKSGLKVSVFSYGTWETFGVKVDGAQARKLMHTAFDHGVNFFDNAEAYANGVSEMIMGEAMRDFKREDLVVSTKLFWGGDGPNELGLSRKHLFEGTKASLKRLRTDYVDLIYCHRPDPDTPIEETVFAMNDIVRQGYALYWGTSEWSAQEIKEAYAIADKRNLIAPTMEQPQYNMINRKRVEVEYAELYEQHGMGTTIFSPLASGLLTGKYNSGFEADSRLSQVTWLRELLEREGVISDKLFAFIDALKSIAERCGATLPQLALAWCASKPFVSSVIIGASKEAQLVENLKAVQIHQAMDATTLGEIEQLIAQYLN